MCDKTYTNFSEYCMAAGINFRIFWSKNAIKIGWSISSTWEYVNEMRSVGKQKPNNACYSEWDIISIREAIHSKNTLVNSTRTGLKIHLHKSG